MTFTLPPLNAGTPIVDGSGRPTPQFQRFWQTVSGLVAGQEGSQDQTLERLKRIPSHTVPTTIVHAADAGTTSTITIDNHTRVYGDGSTLAITGGTRTGLMSDTVYAIYYDDVTLANPAPVFQFTTVLRDAQTIAADGRHFLGVIKTPVAGSGITVDGGGVYAAGSNVGGELDP